MICINELNEDKCYTRQVCEQFVILLSPFAPHISEELWSRMGNDSSILDQKWPKHLEEYLVESTKLYPISINGKTRTQLELSLNLSKEEIEDEVLKNEVVQKWLDGKPPRKVIVVPGKIVNVVL